MLTSSGAYPSKSPIAVPMGVARLKSTMNFMRVEKLEKAFWSAMLIDIASAALWITMESMRLKTAVRSYIKPRAMPSNKACILRAIMRMKGVMLHLPWLCWCLSSPYFKSSWVSSTLLLDSR